PASPVAAVAPAGTVVCTGTHTITQGDLDAGHVDDLGHATSTEATAPDRTDGVKAKQAKSLALTKTDNLKPNGHYDHVGQVVTFTLTATNTSNITLHQVTVTDTPPLDSFSCTPASPVAALAPAGTVVCTGTHTITQGDLDAGHVDDVGHATSTEATA